MNCNISNAAVINNISHQSVFSSFLLFYVLNFSYTQEHIDLNSYLLSIYLEKTSQHTGMYWADIDTIS